MTTSLLELTGCAPIPLGGYLKALGVFRLLAEAEQLDPDLRGFWQDERFCLDTRLSKDDLIRFFRDAYQPTPVAAPWNGGSGFWPKDNRKAAEAIAGSRGNRWAPYRVTIRTVQAVLAAFGSPEAAADIDKETLLIRLRGALSDGACRWLDAAVALSGDGPRYPPLLGTGGNDGRLDFSNNFMQRLLDVIAPAGTPTPQSEEALAASLFAELPIGQLGKGAVGQFAPGAAGGANAGTGFSVDPKINPWDFVLTVEGALAFAAAVVRRNAADRRVALSFPFATKATGAGSGAADFADEADARYEFWAPLWSRPAGFDELMQLLAEGRVVVSDRAARDALDFARAAAGLGVARGITAFQRHAFLRRNGDSYFATPLGRVPVHSNQNAGLIAGLEQGQWLSRTRRAVRDKHATVRLRSIGRTLDEALFRLSGSAAPEAVQQVLMALGDLTLHLGRQPDLCRTNTIPPPPNLGKAWAEAAADDTAEFRLARALAGLTGTEAGADDRRFNLPFRRHLCPVDRRGNWNIWIDTSEAHALQVWSGRDLVRDLGQVLMRRLLEAQHRGFFASQPSDKKASGSDGADQDSLRLVPVLPLNSVARARLSDVRAFLAGRTDDVRITRLAAGLTWLRPVRFDRLDVAHGAEPVRGEAEILPFAYGALKPLLHPAGIGDAPERRRLVDVLPIVRLLLAGRTADAVRLGQARARAAGLPVPFGSAHGAVRCHDPQRLAAALLIPISQDAHNALIARAYAWADDAETA